MHLKATEIVVIISYLIFTCCREVIQELLSHIAPACACFKTARVTRLRQRHDRSQNAGILCGQMALNEQLNKFKQQQARYQTTLSSIAASQASFSKLKLTPGFQPKNAPLAPAKPLQPSKFSNDTQRLRHINSVRKSPTGSQLKLTRQAFTAEQINEATYVDIAGNKDVFEYFMDNVKVLFDGKRYSYKPKHDLKVRDGLLKKIRDNADALDVADVIDSYPSVLEDLQALKESGDIVWLSGTEEGVVYPTILSIKDHGRR
ncbi:hypothetical protein EJB05_07849 [Eragrostis curvula]|uniref:TFA2 Winged helix domain-containing protein n=1 Tax=Eragrostis curvula TaxID=38414 RepID=A0A5J9WLI9_9POAL|nr:hypothetical protein EJB05_07849 [Eragrostis curvula]